MPMHFRQMMHTIWVQSDCNIWNSTNEYGLYFQGTLIFGAIGFIYLFSKFIDSIKDRKYSSEVMIIPTFIGSLIIGACVEVNINRINIAHIPIVCFICYGIYIVSDFVKDKIKYFFEIMVGILFVTFICFISFYFGTYNEEISVQFDKGLDDALEYAMNIREDDEIVYIDEAFYYSNILFYSELPVNTFLDTVEYKSRGAYSRVKKCGPFEFVSDEEKLNNRINIIPADEAQQFERDDVTIEYFDTVAVVRIM